MKFEHLKKKKLGYWQHFRLAMTFAKGCTIYSIYCFLAALKMVCHAFIPYYCEGAMAWLKKKLRGRLKDK